MSSEGSRSTGVPDGGRRVHYGKLPGLKDVYLEDSYVLGIGEDDRALRFTLLVVLRESHPHFTHPSPTDRYCFKLGVLEFRETTAVEWQRRSVLKYRDARGRVDYGNVDVFYRDERGTYHLEGDWGVVDVASSAPVVTLVET